MLCFLECVKTVFVLSYWAQSCLTVCEPMDCSPKGFSVYWIFQVRILKQLVISFSRGPSNQKTEICLLGLLYCQGIFYLVLLRKKKKHKKTKTAKIFSRVVAPCFIPVSNEWEFSLLSNLASSWYFC